MKAYIPFIGLLSISSAFPLFSKIYSKIEDLADDAADYISCKSNIAKTALFRSIPPLSDDEVSEMFQTISESSKPVEKFGDENDLTKGKHLYNFALHCGYAYCDSVDQFPSSENDLRSSLPTGMLNAVRDSNSPNAEYQIAIDSAQEIIILVWRGSKTTKDWFFNFDENLDGVNDKTFDEFREHTSQYSKCETDSNSKFFRGFPNSLSKKTLNGILDGLLEAKTKNPTFSIIITGHSLGGAKAILSAYYLSNFYAKELPIKAVYTYGQPLMGNKAFSNMIANCIGKEKIIRVISEKDIVPFARREKDFDHPDHVTIIYSYKYSEYSWNTCSDPTDSNCGAKTKCVDLTADYHGWFAGLRFGGDQICQPLNIV